MYIYMPAWDQLGERPGPQSTQKLPKELNMTGPNCRPKGELIIGKKDKKIKTKAILILGLWAQRAQSFRREIHFASCCIMDGYWLSLCSEEVARTKDHGAATYPLTDVEV